MLLTRGGGRVAFGGGRVALTGGGVVSVCRDVVVARTREVAARCEFTLDAIRYRYPAERVPDGETPRVVRRLVEQIEGPARGHIATGLVGGQFLHRTLSAVGHADVAVGIATRRDYPSLGYMVERGATTVWELWNGDTADPAMNSGNHVMLAGDLVEWAYADLAGIAPADDGRGFRTIRMAPRFAKGLDFVEAAYDSPYGRVESRWRRAGDRIRWEVTVPVGAEASLADGTILGSGRHVLDR